MATFTAAGRVATVRVLREEQGMHRLVEPVARVAWLRLTHKAAPG